jgi:zinc/manganese transport system substrate-binding protein
MIVRFFLIFVLSTPAFSKPLVVTSFSILRDMVHEIGQDKIEVKSLVGPNQDSHVYEPRPQDGKALGKAALIVVNGFGFEGWIDRLIEASGFQGNVLVATSGMTPLKHSTHGKTTTDPHAWHSLTKAQVYVDNIVKGLSELLPEEAAFFKAQGEAYKEALRALEKETHHHLAAIPMEKRKVITGHNAFGYLGEDLGITFFSPMGLSTESEPSAKAVASLIRQIQAEDIHAIFIENISNARMMEQIALETKSQIGGVLYSDALSPPGTEADTYLKMMRFNLSSLAKAMEKNKTSLTPTVR